MIGKQASAVAWLAMASLLLATGPAAAQQYCNYDSTPATAPASRFTDNGDGTVTDKATGLQWKRCSEGQEWDGATCTGRTATYHTWQQALQLADAASYAGKSDWRLPNIKELASIVEQACGGLAIDLGAFPATPSSSYWSSSPYAASTGYAWVVDFYEGSGDYSKSYYHVRLVRGGQFLPSGGLNDTGLDWWANDSSNSLTTEPTDYPGQDASHGRDVSHDNDSDGHAGFSFTKLDGAGNPLPASATSWSCVRDEVTGLVWEAKTDDGGLRDKDWFYTWHNPDPSTNGDSAGYPDPGTGTEGYGNSNTCHDPARCDTEKYAADVNATGLCGATDWRLPTREELLSLVDYSRYLPAIDTGYFPDVGPNWWYWLSSPHAYAAGKAWVVSFSYGAGASSYKSYGLHVRLVRGGQALASGLPVPIRVASGAGLYIRSGAGTSHSIITEAGYGQELVAFEKSVQGDDLWYRVHLPCGNTGECSGWVAGTYQGATYSVEAPGSTQVEVVDTAPLGLNIRAAPNGSVLDSAYDGQRFVTFASSPAGYGCASPWHRIHLPQSSYATSGWVCGDYARVVGSTQGAVLSLQGQVLEGGAAKAGVTLALSGTASASTTSTSGGYSFASLASGAYTVTPSLAGYQFSPASRSVTLAGASQGGLDFRACHAATPFTVTLTDANGRALSGATVSAGGVTATEVAGGQYQIAGLGCAAGTVTVTAGGSTIQRSFDRFSGAALDLALQQEESAVAGTPQDTGFSRDPVNTATGNYVYQRRDLAIPGIGMAFQLDRSYNSREASAPGDPGAPLGYGWSHSYQISLTVSAGDVTLRWGDGHTATFVPDGAGGFTPPSGVFDTLTDNGDGTHTLTKRDRTAYSFDTAGRLALIADKNGNTIALGYAGGNLSSITDTAGRVVQFTYDPQGRLTRVTDPGGRTVQYAYDGNGDLVSATDPNSNATTYTYDGAHQISAVVDPRGHTVVSNTYDAARRVVTYQTDAKGGGTTFSYQELDRVTTVTDALNNVTVHQHDELLRLVREEDARGGVALYEYDAAGNRVAVTDKNGNLTRYGYDARGNVVSKTDALGGVTTITYDADDNPLTRTDPLGHLTRFEYDARGNLLRTTDALEGVTSVTYDTRGLPLKVTDPLGHVTTSAYDGQGNLTRVTDALGKVTTYTYDGVGRRLSTTAPLARTTTFTYDGNDHLLTVTDPAGHTLTHAYDANGNRIRTTDRRGNVTEWAYDEKDLVVSETDALGQVERYTYDALDRRLTRTDRRGHVTTYGYDAVGNLVEVLEPLEKKSTFTYDLAGNRLAATHALERATTYQYDGLGRVTRVKDPLGQVTLTTYDANGNRLTLTDPRGNVTHYAYDALNRLVQVTDPLGHTRRSTYDAAGNRLTVTDALGQATIFTYDALNRPVAEADPLGHTRATAYDAAGRVRATTDANGRTTAFVYDALDRLTRVTDAAGGVVSYRYDRNGNRLSLTDPNGNTTTYAYDKLNRRTTMTEPLGHVTRFAYDSVGNLTRKTDPKGQVIHYTYDALDRRASIDYPAQPDVGFGYDAVGNLVTMTDGLGTTTHAYDALGRRTRTTDPFGKIIRYGYDANGNRTRLTYPGSKMVTYAYDAANRMTRVTDWLGRVTRYSYDAADRLIGTTNANGTTTAYAYDTAGRLTALTNATAAGAVINAYQYTLDPVGNHLAEDRAEPLAPALPAEVVTDTHDAENRLLTSNGTPNTFDANGNLTAKGASSYVYDAADRLVGTGIDGTTTFYQYDGLGNRYRRTRAGVETRFVLDTNTALTNVLAETDGTGAVQAWNVYGQRLIARILPDNSVLQYHYDSRGSTIALTDAAGAPVQQYAYDPFGRIANREGSQANPFGFLGRYGVLDEGDDLNYVRARYYDSEQQRFVSKDAKLGEDRAGQTSNRYAYALNNSTSLVDISGFDSREVIAELIAKIAPTNATPIVEILLSYDASSHANTTVSTMPAASWNWKDVEKAAQEEVRDLSWRVIKKFGTKTAVAAGRGAIFAYRQGYKTVGEWLGSVKGATIQTTGGSKIRPILANIVGDYLLTKTLDAIEGKGEEVPILGGIPLVGKILFRYHYAGEEVDQYGNVFAGGEFLGNLRDPHATEPILGQVEW